MTVSLFSVVKGGVSLATTTVGCSKDVLVLDGASNVGNVAVGCVETSVTEFREPIQVQSHQEMPRILVQLGHIQCT